MKKIIFFITLTMLLLVVTAHAESDFSNVVYTAYGDSITDIYQDEGITKYPELMKTRFSLSAVNNFGISSSCLARRDEQKVLSGVENILQHSDKNKTSQIVTICYGTNDWYCGVKLGSMDDTDTSTYWGAFNTAVKKLREDNPSVEIIVLSPIWRDDVLNNNGSGSAPYYKNKTGVTLGEYVDEIEKMCAANSVRFVNLYSDMGVRPQTVSLYTSDGLHPNQKGHIRIANLLKNTFEETLLMNEFDGIVYNDGYDPSDTVVPDPTQRISNIEDFVDTTRGAVTGLDLTNNRPQKEESTGNIVSKEGVHNFYIQTTNESSNIFNFFTDGTYAYGVLLSNSVNYGRRLLRTNLETGEIDNTASFLEYSEYYSLPDPGKNLWHFMYSAEKDAWYIYTVDADGNETFTAKITKKNLECSLWSDLSAATPLFAYRGWGTYCFTLISDDTPSAKFTLEDETLTTELNNVDELTLAYGVYDENGELTDVKIPEIVDNKASASLKLDAAEKIRIYFWTSLEKLNPVMKDESIDLR